jgi:hypothetical protein
MKAGTKNGQPLQGSRLASVSFATRVALFDYVKASLTLPNLVSALVPIVVIVPMQTTMIRAIMTAYSTAVGPSSEIRNCLTLAAKFFIAEPLFSK